MQNIIKLKNPPSFFSHAAVGGYEERRGPLGENFDFSDESDRFGMKTFESAEGEMGRLGLNLALKKGSLSHERLSLIVAGDLQNQCVASSGGLFTFGVPYIGLYGACSTCTEALMTLAVMMSECEKYEFGAAVTSSHNSAAERQFRLPLEYGGQRPPTAQWTATAAGAFVLTRGPGRVIISEAMPGKIVDGAIKDASNMGAAMARAAADSIISYFSLSGLSPSDFDSIVTGDLGAVGSDILAELLSEAGLSEAARRHLDCGLLLYDRNTQDVHAGGSGCGCSASVLSTYFLPRLGSGRMKNILFLSTGALMSPQSVQQGQTIAGIAPAIRIISQF